MDSKVLILTEKNIMEVMRSPRFDVIEIVERALEKHTGNHIIVPDKISQIFNQETQERINCMTATLLDEKVSGVKWISVFPPNILKGISNVNGSLLLTEIEHGKLLSVMSASCLTTIRTAAVGAVAAKYLAKKKTRTVGFIGAGEEAKMHLVMLCKVRPEIRKCKVASRRSESEEKFIGEMSKIFPEIEFEACNSDYEKAVKGADIIVTATSSQLELLKSAWIEQGMLYIHVGGLEDEFGVSEKANKIVCDSWEAVKHRAQTISRRYIQGELEDDDIYGDIGNIISGKIAAREKEDEFIYFNSVGLATVDVYFAHCIYQSAKKNHIGIEIDMEQRECVLSPYLI